MITIDSTHGLSAVADTARDAVGVLGRHLAATLRTADVTFLVRDHESDRWTAGTMFTYRGPKDGLRDFVDDELRRVLRYLTEPEDDGRPLY